MNRLIVTTLSVAVAAAPALASAEDLSLSSTIAFESRYVFRGLQLSEESFQPAATLAWGRLTATGWFNFPIDNEDPGARRAEEIDLVLDYQAPLGHGLTLGVGATYYVYPERDRGFFDVFREDGSGLGANSFEPYLSLAIDAPLSPKVYLFHDVDFDTTTAQANLSHSVPLTDKASFDLSGYVGYVFDDRGGTDYLYGVASANVSMKITKTASVYAGGRFGGSDVAGGSIFDGLGLRKSAGFWAGAGLTVGF